TTVTAGSSSTASKRSSTSSTAGSRATSTAPGAAPCSVPQSPVVGSSTSTGSAPTSRRAACRRSQAVPGRASSATRIAGSVMALRLPVDRPYLRQQLEHVAQQLVLLVGLAQVALHADLERAL